MRIKNSLKICFFDGRTAVKLNLCLLYVDNSWVPFCEVGLERKAKAFTAEAPRTQGKAKASSAETRRLRGKKYGYAIIRCGIWNRAVIFRASGPAS